MESVQKPEGAIVAQNGEVIIPQSKRPDGTLRKERKVKQGYVPPDEIQKFETTASRRRSLHGGNEGFVVGMPIGASPTTQSTTSKKKKKKKKPAQSKDRVDDLQSKVEALEIGKETETSASPPSTAASVEKKIKNLKKKLRQIQDLEKRKADGEELSVEQLEKIERHLEIEKEIQELEEHS